MKLLLFGAGGQVGRETLAAAPLSFEVIAPSRAEADLANPGAAAEAIFRIRPDFVINAAAFTAVDRAESEKEAAFRVNAAAAGEIAEAAARAGARLLHLSTDYVFPGNGDAPLEEEAPAAPLNVYGASKLEGEKRVRAAHPAAVVLRTSWVFAAHGANFVRTMLRLAQERAEVSVVADQQGGPTPAAAIAAAALKVAARPDGAAGVFHFQGAPAASWADFAEAIFECAGAGTRVRRIKTADYPAPALRPLNTTLNCSKILTHYGVRQPDWRKDLSATVERLMRDRGLS